MSTWLFDASAYQQTPSPPATEIDDTTLGAISEHIVETRCLERGLTVSRPFADSSGVDLVIAGKRTQVKSTRKPRTNKNGWLHYRFKAGRGSTGRFDKRSHQCDVFAFYAHDSGKLWLLRSEDVRTRWRSNAAALAVTQTNGLNDFSVFA
jgi:hypothetical protein